jgi:hypothetical protein
MNVHLFVHPKEKTESTLEKNRGASTGPSLLGANFTPGFKGAFPLSEAANRKIPS